MTEVLDVVRFDTLSRLSLHPYLPRVYPNACTRIGYICKGIPSPRVGVWKPCRSYTTVEYPYGSRAEVAELVG